MYQLLNFPHAIEDMTTGISITGITVLKTGRYLQRHTGMSDVRQLPYDGLIEKKEYEELLKGTKEPKRKKKVDPLAEKKEPVKREKKGKFIVNRKEVSHRIRGFVNQMKGEKKLYFWTVTFPEKTSDDTAHVLLNKWLTRLRKENMLRSYLWISERQKNGTIHFHIALHQRICVKKANKYMRACIFTSIDNKAIDYTREAAKNYNGIDIAKNRKTRRVTNFAQGKNAKNLTNYLTKYVTKNNQEFTHLAWHSSRDYSNLCIAIHITSREYDKYNLTNLISKEQPYENDWIIFYKWIASPPPDLLNYLALLNQGILTKLGLTY